MTSPRKEAIFELSSRHLCPAKVATFRAIGVDLVIGRREGYRLWDVDGEELIDAHLNGGTFNLGHRHPELVATLRDGLETLDIGNHHFASEARAELAAMLARVTPGDLTYTVFASGGGEAVDVAIKTARRSTGRRRIVSVEGGYHGHTGLALAAGADRFSEPFHSQGDPAGFTRVPWDDVDAMARELEKADVAGVIVEPIPATAGFPMPSSGYLKQVQELCRHHGALLIADEVQTGLGRTGALWACDKHGVEPDVLVTAKGLSGGLYPIAATVISERHAGWLATDSHGHVSTFGGAELGCFVAMKVLEITQRASTLDNVRNVGAALGIGLRDIARRHPFLAEVRQDGCVIGLRFDRSDGAIHVMRALYEVGVWAIFAGFDSSVLQLKPGLLYDETMVGALLERLDKAIGNVERLLVPTAPASRAEV